MFIVLEMKYLSNLWWFKLLLFRAKFLFFPLLISFGFRVEKSLVSKYLQLLALKEKSIISIIVATKSAQLLQNVPYYKQNFPKTKSFANLFLL
jgi:hypothetical protein